MHNLTSKLLLYSLNRIKSDCVPGTFNIQRVLVAPLDWGLGHATRCIPIIDALNKRGFQVFIAAEGAQKALLEKEFPGLTMLSLKGYRVQYSRKKGWLPFKLLAQLPGLLQTIAREHRWLEEIVETHSIDLVISDNRYGLYSSRVPCVFMTHQLRIKARYHWLESLIQKIHYHYIERFKTCWVPDDVSENNIGGSLSHPHQLPRIPVHYIGLLTRFHSSLAEHRYDRCIILSGPEPQRTLLEQRILADLANIDGQTLLVRGKPGSEEKLALMDGVRVENHLSTAALQEAILQSDVIICRSGYTTIMELMALKKRSILIPTPGQTEQEYLASLLKEKQFAYSEEQTDFDLFQALIASLLFPYQWPVLHRFCEKDLPDLLKASL